MNRRKFCPVCTRLIEHQKRGRPRQYCSNACKQTWHRLKVPAGDRDAFNAAVKDKYGSRIALYLRRGWPVPTCLWCGVYLEPYEGKGRPKKFCNASHRWSHWNKKHPGLAEARRKRKGKTGQEYTEKTDSDALSGSERQIVIDLEDDSWFEF